MIREILGHRGFTVSESHLVTLVFLHSTQHISYSTVLIVVDQYSSTVKLLGNNEAFNIDDESNLIFVLATLPVVSQASHVEYLLGSTTFSA